ncbi:primase-like DNA-binding domain-containing protein [Ruegeria atlantica]|uniref:primase-like DNA-binding domain-containing protein n=1 Tax=Ruegeria atlantica TaxID=81569 RepID=UPI0011AE2BD3|nr:primase-like DNA-binding domain-containing protein [Ruegeria atlantica]
MQYFFKHIEDTPTSSKKAASHIDTRGDGGYVIAPGSVMGSGADYSYEGRSLSAALEAGDVPASITSASNAYFHDEDILGQFLEDETAVDTGSFVTSSALHQRFGQWCEQQGLQPWTQRTLQKEMKSRQFVSMRRNSGRGFLHLKLKFG